MTSRAASASAKAQFWRIQNIKTSERDDVTKWLQEQVKDLAISEGQGFSLAADSERTLCATLTSYEQPTPSKRGWRVDKDFIGFTPLSDPEDANVDIVAVTGLGGHALGSFRSADGLSVWLRDFAPEDIPRARLITYGYDTAIVASHSNQGIRELAHTLLDELIEFRRSTLTQQRSLLFVCHSLGGVVLKEALVMSSKATEPEQKEWLEVVKVTYGLVFLGVPNLGLRHIQLKTVVRGQPNQAFIEDLLVKSDGEASQFLKYLTREFSDLDRRRSLPFDIISYYETVHSPTIVALEDGRFATTGPKEFMVTDSSAERIGRLVRGMEHLPSQVDHRGLVRFEHSRDTRYRSMIGKLRRMAAEAPEALQSRAQSGYFGGAIQVSQAPKPLRYLPFFRNYNFIGRTDEIDVLERNLFAEQDCQEIAVVGLGGVGKTHVALQFAYAVLENHSDVSVFWIHALSLETFEQSCREVASVLKILGGETDKRDVKELVKRHLSADKAGKWMLIVDNADDMGILEGSDGLLDHLPKSDSGLTVFTTRDKTTAQALAGNCILEVEKLDFVTASALFKKMLTRKDILYEEAVVDELLQELDCLPLAITQATAYVNTNAISVEEYLRLLRNTEQDLIFVMGKEMRDSTRYKHAANAVAKTWLVSFEQILQQDDHAAILLQYMSWIDWKAIPRSILPTVKPEAQMTCAIGTLWSYSLITARSDGKTYDMHRLVHVAVQVWIQQKGLVAETQRKALEHLSEVFPSFEWENREIWREYIPHAARMRDVQSGGPVGARGLLCLKVGRCLGADGRIQDAVGWLEESRDLKSNLPEDDANRLASQHEFAIAYLANGQVEEAVRLLEHVVAVKRVLAEDRPDLLASQQVLATAYRANGQVKEAVRLLEHVVAIWKRVLAEDHPYLLASQHSLAIAYESSGQVKDAVQLLEHIVAIERVLAEDHPDLLTSQHALAMAYESSGQVKDAIQLLEHVVAIRMRVLAEDHPDLLSSEHNLAWAYLYNRQYKKAVQLLEQVVAMQGQVLAEDHHSRLLSQQLLARAYKAAGHTVKLESQPSSQADEQGAGPSSAARSTAQGNSSFLVKNHRNTRLVHGGPSQVEGGRTNARGNLKRLWQKLKEKR